MKCNRSYAPLGLFVGLALLFQVGTVWAALDFEFGQTFAVGKRASTIDAGDLDGDGDLDLATANIFGHSITIAWNDGTGRFSELEEIPLEEGLKYPVALKIGDLDGKGNLDLVVANIQDFNLQQEAGIIIFFSEQDGTYYKKYHTIDGIPSSIEIADINNDNLNDIVVGNNGVIDFNQGYFFPGGVYPYINKGYQIFEEEDEVFANVGSIVDIETFDADQDGTIDVVGVNQGELNILAWEMTNFDISCFLNSENGLYYANNKVLNLQPHALDSVDLDGDQQIDIAVSFLGDMDFISYLGTNTSVDLFRNEGGRFNLMTSIPRRV